MPISKASDPMTTRNSVEPIQQSVVAKPHRPIYRMHRYFARRPYSVFAELIKHYTDEGQVVLDPFCGGGVTLVEGVIQGRRVIGFDANPLAAFITEMELAAVSLQELKEAQAQVCRSFRTINNELFSTICQECKEPARAMWFEYSARVECPGCARAFRIVAAEKTGAGIWKCPHCDLAKRFSPKADTPFEIVNVACDCAGCGHQGVQSATDQDAALAKKIENRLKAAERRGLWLPDTAIPDCNMQRESALFKKGIVQFRQLFTSRHLLALGLLREQIQKMSPPLRMWLLFSFSSTLRYTNRMVTRNAGWRGDRPLEWAKPGYWLPPVHLEPNVLEEFSRRCKAVWRGKEDYVAQLNGRRLKGVKSACEVLEETSAAFHISARSSTVMPLPDKCIDAIITDPPYGSYVHYADLSNFWSAWLEGVSGLGKAIDTSDEAVIARKKFPGAKDAADYQKILEKCFVECFRVLKPSGYMVMTFHNREPRAWAALLVAATKAGFDLPSNGIVFQDGIASYKHTAQSRRSGSVIGDFILSFQKPLRALPAPKSVTSHKAWSEKEFRDTVEKLLREKGPLTPNALISRLYIEFQPHLLKRVRAAVAHSDGAAETLIEDFDGIQLLDSHRRQLLERDFNYKDGKWSLRPA